MSMTHIQTRQRGWRLGLLSLMALCMALLPSALHAAGKQEKPQAKEVFTKAYDHFYGKEGVRFNYKISILGIYHEEGWACYKGEKSKSAHAKTVMWNNGSLLYKLRLDKRLVEIHDPKVNKEDQMLQKFKFYPDEFNYSLTMEGSDYLVTLKAKKDAKNTKMKEVRIVVDPETYYPRQLRIKVLGLFWAKVSFTDFKAGNISDATFEFPKEKYADCKYEDRR